VRGAGQRERERRWNGRSILVAVVIREDIGESIGHCSAKTSKKYLEDIRSGKGKGRVPCAACWWG
jgi:hypothetical protein